MQQHPTLAASSSAPRPVPAHVPRPAPAMQVVTKGWWVLREERVNAEDLLRQDEDERK
ncbi:hypothetical protein [Plastoroseomonas arctica]|uniref:Uncharacterized protein n=1 Tax=Plastoroseomonas arctica TaxID=1509237 RepID=A0AAF1JUK3_9PROT|nr:hypothetical protein [Plastoroseomonas arctica]MBR0653962.1 hypothetical protein [Plastoroseomonas arctica]